MTVDVHRTIEAIFRIESARLIAGIARMVRDVGLAEELAQDAMVKALEKWPITGVPDQPGAWLMQTAKHAAIDVLRRHKRVDRKHEELGEQMTERERTTPDFAAAVDDDIGDDMLRLMFTACHPVLSMDARVALTLRLLGGLTTVEIARAFLTTEPTMQQRILRAKKTLGEAGVAFELPRETERAERLASVLEVIYLVFNEGYAASSGDDWLRPDLCNDALRLGRILVSLVPHEPEAYGLLSLMEIQGSRAAARVDARGEPIVLLEQNRARWDHGAIQRGLAALARAEQLGGADGFYTLQAAIAACHARARTAEQTEWSKIVALYTTLLERVPSPVIALNRAVAVSFVSGPAAALAIVDELGKEPALVRYHLLPSVRADLLDKLGRKSEAAREFERAARLANNEREKQLLLRRAAACRS